MTEMIYVNQDHHYAQQYEAMESIRHKFDQTTPEEWYVRNTLISKATEMGLPEEFVSQLKKDNL